MVGPIQTASSEIAKLLQPFRDDFQFYAPRCLKIRTKEGGIAPLRLNKAQLYLHKRLEEQLKQTGKIRALGLKGRQQGFSTYVEGRFYHRTSLNFGKRAGILTHQQASTDALFEMTKRYHDECPSVLRPKTSAASAKELKFADLDSGYFVATARSEGVGRGFGGVQYFHGCLAPTTLIVDGLTGELVEMQMFEVGDLVRTHTGEVAPVSFISQQTKRINRVKLKGLNDYPLEATDEHRFWTPDGWKELGDIQVGDKIGYPVSKVENAGISWLFRMADSARPQGGGTRETGPERVEPSYDLGRILGLYLAEGAIVFQSNGGHPSAVTFSVHDKEAERTLEWLKPLEHLFTSVRVTDRKDCLTTTVTAYGRSFADFVLTLCGRTHTKRLPYDWRLAGEDFVRGLVHGYLAGDGHFSPSRDRRISATGIRSAITTGMREALAALGYGWASVEFKEPAIRHGRNEKAAFVLRLCGQGVDRLSAELGKPCVPRKRVGNYSDVEVRDGYAWLPVLSKEDIGEQPVMDFEVAHPDHSYCTIHGATHNSEVAFWPNAEDHFAGVMQAIPNARGTEVILESTANGPGNLFYEMWQDAEAGKGEYVAIFVPWFWQDEYRLPVPEGFILDAEEAEYAELYDLDVSQMVWRRAKIRDEFRGDVALFDQEYPATSALAFRRVAGDPLIDMALIERAKQCTNAEPRGRHLIGVDPAEYGDDDTGIAHRQGRVLHSIEGKHGQSQIETANYIARKFGHLKENAEVMVDCTGGYGSTIVDLLLEWGWSAHRVMFGEKAVEDDLYANRRTEIWCDMAKWYEDTPCSIPDNMALVAQTGAPQYTYDSSRRKVLESKEKMRARGVKSPDLADAVALTHAYKFPAEGQSRGLDRGRVRSSWRT